MKKITIALIILAFAIGALIASAPSDPFNLGTSSRAAQPPDYIDADTILNKLIAKNGKLAIHQNYIQYEYVDTTALGNRRIITYIDYDQDGIVDKYEIEQIGRITDLMMGDDGEIYFESRSPRTDVEIGSRALYDYLPAKWKPFYKYAPHNLQRKINHDYKLLRTVHAEQTFGYYCDSLLQTIYPNDACRHRLDQ